MLEDHIGVDLLRLRLARQPRLLSHEPRQRHLYLYVVFALENLTYIFLWRYRICSDRRLLIF
jgi:hypothetical protein